MTTPPIDELFACLGETARRTADEHRVPGLALGVDDPTGSRMLLLGTADASGRPVERGTRFRWCSITKVVLATLALELDEAGELDLDAPIGDELGDLGHPLRSRITPRMLLMHTSGIEGEWPESLATFGADDDALGRVVARYSELRQFAAPGAAWGYCNPGFWLLGRLIEVRLAMSIETAVRRRVFDPLGLAGAATSLDEAERLDPPGMADPYSRAAGGGTGLPWVLDPRMPRARFSSGGIIGSTDDLLAFGRAQLRSTSRLQRVAADSVDTDSAERRQGIGWMVERTVGGEIFDHSGYFPGFASQLSVVPEHGIVVSVLGNSSGAWDVREAVHTQLRAALGGSAPVVPVPSGRPSPGTYDYPEVDRLILSADEASARLRILERDGRVEESALEPLVGRGYRVVDGEFAGCELSTVPGQPHLIRLAERLGRWAS